MYKFWRIERNTPYLNMHVLHLRNFPDSTLIFPWVAWRSRPWPSYSVIAVLLTSANDVGEVGLHALVRPVAVALSLHVAVHHDEGLLVGEQHGAPTPARGRRGRRRRVVVLHGGKPAPRFRCHQEVAPRRLVHLRIMIGFRSLSLADIEADAMKNGYNPSKVKIFNAVRESVS